MADTDKNDLWERLERTWIREACRALSALGQRHPDQQFYAVVLHGLYAEEHGLIGTPLLAANSVEAAREAGYEQAEGFFGAWWNPADFRWEELDMPDATFLETEQAVTAEACSAGTKKWRQVHQQHRSVIISVARQLARRAPQCLATTEDFVAMVHDPAEAVALARQTIDPALFARLFPDQLELGQQRDAVAAMPAARRVRFYISRLGIFEGIDTEEAQEKLIELGQAAVGPLVELLPDPHQGWTAAKLLGHIGVASPPVLEALRRMVSERKNSASWSARALGALGDDDFLLNLAGEEFASLAAAGIVTHLQAWFPGCRELDYGPLSRLLTRGEPFAQHAQEELKPGRPCCHITPEELPTVLEALQSAQTTIRSHAVRVLGDRRLGRRHARAVLEALVQAALQDPEAEVRKLAVLSVKSWKKTGARYHDRLRPLLDDPDDRVRKMTRYVLG